MPYIKPQSIDDLLEKADLLEIVSLYCEPKKNGATFKACCPVHDEKTPSFVISPSKNLVKCFGCGFAAVGPLNFIMQHKNLEFYEAVDFLAKHYNFTLEFEEYDDPKAAEKAKIKRKQKTSAYSIVKAAAVKYLENLNDLPEKHKVWSELLDKRALSKETIDDFQIGFAPENLRFITKLVNDKDIFDDAQAAGLVKKNENGAKHDIFINRIIFPITNNRNSIVGFGAQNMGDEKYAKYKNSADNVIYNKKKNLFGIHLAQKAIKDKGYAIVTEGYYDVISIYDKGIQNIVASCGTAFTTEQADLLKKFTNKICFAFDGDESGTKALIRAMKIAIAKGFDTQCVLLHEGADMDDLSRMYNAEELLDYIEKGKGDCLFWYVNYLIEKVDSATDKHEATENIASIVSTIPLPVAKAYYEKELCKKLGSEVKLTQFKDLVKKQAEKSLKSSHPKDDLYDNYLPKHVDRDEWLKHGFYEEYGKGKAGYYFHNSNGTHTAQSNFIVRPLFHLYSLKDNKRLIEINNGIEYKIMELPSQSMIKVDQFAGAVYDEGNYLFNGGKPHLMKILNKISGNFPLCYELKTLGQQPEGFFAYSNAVFNKQIEPIDEYGIAMVDEKNYFSPSVSKIYQNLRKDDDEFENDRYLKFDRPNTTFKEWAELVKKVYPDKYIYAFSYICVALFRDIVFKIDNNCPLLYCYGKKGSGKSKLGESISSFFFRDLPGFNLTQGTDFAFASRLSRFRNCVVLFEEFDDNVVKPERFQALKGSFDGTGRERGRGGKRDRSEIMHVNSSPILNGQYLSTADDNALLSRCITIEFKPNTKRTNEQLEAYEKLKELEKKDNLSGLIPELLNHRKELEKEYPKLFSETYFYFRDHLVAKKENFEDRILRNYTALATMLKFFSKKVALNIEEDLTTINLNLINDVINLSSLIEESDSLGSYWTILEQLIEKGDIKEGQHFRIIEETSFKVRKNRKIVEDLNFGHIKKLLLLRTSAIHGYYAEAAARQRLISMNLSTLNNYIAGIPAFIGNCKGYRFKNDKNIVINTSCIVVDFDKLSDKLKNITGCIAAPDEY